MFRPARTAAEPRERRAAGQTIALFALALTALVLVVGLVVDGGYAWAQRRGAQNAADLGSIAGARIVGLKLSGATADGTTVIAAIDALNQANAVPNLTAGQASYVDNNGVVISAANGGAVTAGQAIPASARGVQVGASKSWKPFFLGVVGITDWTASATATAKASISRITTSPSGDLLPLAMPLNSVPANLCPEGTPAASCTSTNIAQGSGPGQFGWMSWSGVGNAVYTCDIMTPPLNNPVYTVPADSFITIPGNTGVSASSCLKAAFQYWIDSGATIYVPIVSPGPGACPLNCYPGTSTPYPPTSQGNGANVTYNVIGFAGFQLTGCDGKTDASKCKIDNIQGVYRQIVFTGPTGTSVPGGTTLTGLAIQLVK